MANGSIMQSLIDAQNKAVQANLQRYDQAMAIYDSVIQTYSPGGAFEKRRLEDLETLKTQTVGQELSGQISSGLFGLSTTPQLSEGFEATTGARERTNIEDIMFQRLTGAQMGKAGFIERREDVGPDMGLLAQLAAQSPTGPGYTEPKTQLRTYGGTYGASSFPDMFSIAGQPRAGGTGPTVTGTGKTRPASSQLYDPMKAKPLPEVTQAEIQAATGAEGGTSSGQQFFANALEAQKAGPGSLYKNRFGTVYKINAKGNPVRQG